MTRPQGMQLTRSRALILWVGSIVVAALYAAHTWSGRASLQAEYPYDNPLLTDFRDTGYLPARAMSEGLNVYDVPRYLSAHPQAQEFDAYAPWWLSATAPLARLSWDGATAVWLTLTVVAYVGTAYALGSLISRRLHSLPDPATVISCRAACLALILVWRPATISFQLGNASSIVVVATAIALTGVGGRAGMLLVAVAWIKPQFGLPLCLALLAFPGRWKQAVGGTALAVVASLPAVFELARAAGGLRQLVDSVFAGMTRPRSFRQNVASTAESTQWVWPTQSGDRSGWLPPSRSDCARLVWC